MTVSFDSGEVTAEEIFGGADAVFETGFSADYAAYANYGTDPHWPPLTPMLEWTERMGWDNPGLDDSMSEDEMWAEVDRRKAAREPLPSAYLFASHMAESGTEGLMFASDAYNEAIRKGESWVEAQDYPAETPPDVIAREFLNWTFEKAQGYLIERVSSATRGQAGLLGTGYPAVEVDG